MPDEVSALVGVKARGFELPDEHGDPVSLEDLLGKGPVVLAFMPHPPRGVCNKTVCGLRDSHSRLQDAGARVVAISPMSPRTHERVKRERGLSFVFLSDRDRAVSGQYGVRPVMGFIPGRATFVLDSRGIIQWVERNPAAATKHVEGAIRVVQRLVNTMETEEVT